MDALVLICVSVIIVAVWVFTFIDNNRFDYDTTMNIILGVVVVYIIFSN